MMDPTDALLVLSRTATPTPDPATAPPADPYVGFFALTTEGIAAPTFQDSNSQAVEENKEFEGGADRVRIEIRDNEDIY